LLERRSTSCMLTRLGQCTRNAVLLLCLLPSVVVSSWVASVPRVEARLHTDRPRPLASPWRPARDGALERDAPKSCVGCGNRALFLGLSEVEDGHGSFWSDIFKDDAFWESMFHCSNKYATDINTPLSQIFLGFCALCLFVGTIGFACEHQYRDQGGAPDFWGPRLHYYSLVCSCFGGCLVYAGVALSKVMVIVGFIYCRYFVFMAIYIMTIMVAQVFSAHEYALEGKDLKERTSRFILALLQVRMFLDARESWRQGKILRSFARQKFVDSILESGPQAVFMVYVIYYLRQQTSIWLELSVLGSIISMGSGITVWMDHTFGKQLVERKVPPEEFSIGWYHYVLWFSYFATDFSMRLLTLAVFLSASVLYPFNVFACVFLLAIYFTAALITISRYYEEEERHQFDFWQVGRDIVQVERAVVVQRIRDILILTFLVHVLPADLRLAPKSKDESRKNIVLHTDVRRRLLQVIIPLRALDYLTLGGTVMYFNYNPYQCAGMVFIFFASHVLLYEVMSMRRPLDDDVPDEVLRHSAKQLA